MSSSVSKGFSTICLEIGLAKTIQTIPPQEYVIQVSSPFTTDYPWFISIHKKGNLRLHSWNFLDGSVLAKTIAGRVCRVHYRLDSCELRTYTLHFSYMDASEKCKGWWSGWHAKVWQQNWIPPQFRVGTSIFLKELPDFFSFLLPQWFQHLGHTFLDGSN